MNTPQTKIDLDRPVGAPSKPPLRRANITVPESIQKSFDDSKVEPVETDQVRFVTDVDERNLRTVAMVMLLRNLRGTHVLYKNTVPAHVKAKRRARGKAAKRSRKLNRG